MEQTVRENNKTLYSPKFEHDNCGIGAVVNIKGIKSHDTVANALTIVETLEHRAGKDAEGKTGDGVGILLQISHKFFKKAAAEIGIKLGSERDYAVGMFFFPQNEQEIRQRRCLKSLQKKKVLQFSAGEMFLQSPRSSVTELLNVCLQLCSALSKDLTV